MVRCRHWSGTLMLKVDSAKNGLLLRSYGHGKWETSSHHIGYEDFTDYYIV